MPPCRLLSSWTPKPSIHTYIRVTSYLTSIPPYSATTQRKDEATSCDGVMASPPHNLFNKHTTTTSQSLLSPLFRYLPTKWKCCRCCSFATPELALICMHIWLMLEYWNNAKSGLKSLGGRERGREGGREGYGNEGGAKK